MPRVSPMKCVLLALGLLALPASAAQAEEAIRTGPDSIPAAAAAIEALPSDTPAPPTRLEATDDEPTPESGRCDAPPDRKPHGMVWGAVGTGGYREAGAVVTQPIGRCASVTVMINRTDGGGYDRRGRR